jgi:hypothetical protein
MPNEPTAGSLDTPSVKTTEMGGERGFDAGKRPRGRTRGIVVDVLGLLITVVVVMASRQGAEVGRRLGACSVSTVPGFEVGSGPVRGRFAVASRLI